MVFAVGVTPLYAEVAIWDAERPDYPEWGIRGEQVVATDRSSPYPHAPPMEMAGIRAWQWKCGSEAVDRGTGPFIVLFIGGLTVGARGVFVGNVVAGDTHAVPLPHGDHLVEVWINVDFGGRVRRPVQVPRRVNLVGCPVPSCDPPNRDGKREVSLLLLGWRVWQPKPPSQSSVGEPGFLPQDLDLGFEGEPLILGRICLEEVVENAQPRFEPRAAVDDPRHRAHGTRKHRAGRAEPVRSRRAGREFVTIL